jgi:HAD superfamily hydrolase (TIGR01509 family)
VKGRNSTKFKANYPRRLKRLPLSHGSPTGDQSKHLWHDSKLCSLMQPVPYSTHVSRSEKLTRERRYDTASQPNLRPWRQLSTKHLGNRHRLPSVLDMKPTSSADSNGNGGAFSNFVGYFNFLFEFFADPAHWVVDPETIATLRKLREQGLVLGVISNFDYRLYGILEGLGLKAYFDSITISSEVGYAKPSPKLFAAALERHRLMPSEAVHVGDSEHLDVAGASAAGITAILLSRKPDSRSEFKQRKVSSLGEVISLLPLLEESSGGR